MIELFFSFLSFFLEGENSALNRFAFNIIIYSFLALLVSLIVVPLVVKYLAPFVVKWSENFFDNSDYIDDIFKFFDRLANKLVNAGPGLLTTTGIFFTFLGITIGLKDFDPSSEDLRKNVIELLNGMKLAFFSSVVAIGLSIVFKFLSSFVRSFHKEEFQQIKEALGGDNLQEWQKEYKKKIKELVRAHEQIKESLQKSDTAVKGIATQTEKIPAFLEKMNDVIEGLGRQKEMLQEEIKNLTGTFAEMRDKAVTAMPFLENKLKDLADNMTQLTQNMQKVVEENNSMTKKVSDAYKKFPDTMEESLNQFRESMRNNIKESVTETEKSLNQFRDGMKTSVQESVTILGESITGISREFETQLERVRRHTEALADLDKSLRSQKQKRPSEG